MSHRSTPSSRSGHRKSALPASSVHSFSTCIKKSHDRDVQVESHDVPRSSYLTTVDDLFSDFLTRVQPVLLQILEYVDTFTLCECSQVCHLWRRVLCSREDLQERSNSLRLQLSRGQLEKLQDRFKHTFQYESKHHFHMKQYGNAPASVAVESETGMSSGGVDALIISPQSSFRIKYMVRHVCLLRAKEAMTHHIKHIWFNEQLQPKSGETWIVPFREQLLHWSERIESEKHEFVSSLLRQVQHWDRDQILTETWDYTRQRVTYTGDLGGFHCSVTVLPSNRPCVKIDEMEDNLEHDDLSLTFHDQLRFTP